MDIWNSLWSHTCCISLNYIFQNCWNRVIDMTSFEKHLESYLDHTPNFCRNLLIFCSKNISKGFSHPVVYGDLVYKLRRVKATPNFISLGSKMCTVWPIDHREDYRSCAWHFYSLVQTFPISIALWQTRRLGLYDGPCPNLLRGDKVLIFVPYYCQSGLLQSSFLSSLPDGRSIACPIRMSLYIFLM